MNVVKTAMCIPKHKIECDAETGEVLSGETEYVVLDANWVKVWVEPLFEVLTKLTKSQLKVASFILCGTCQKTNHIDFSPLRIADYTSVSEEVVKETLLILIKNDIIRKIDISTYMLNPMLVYYGKDNKQLLKKYHAIETTYKKNFTYPYVWRKFWVRNFMNKMNGLSGKSLMIVHLLIKNIDSKNQIKITQREIVEKTGLSVQTVNKTMLALRKNGFFVKHEGYLIIDPHSIASVPYSDRVFIKDEFKKIELYFRYKKS